MQHTTPQKPTQRVTRGYALLTAVIISALIISVATSIASLTVRQLRTHALISDSFIAQNAAMAGYECAYFWDTDPAVIEDQALGPFYPGPALTTISCFEDGGVVQTITIDPGVAPAGPIQFAANVGSDGCVEVFITKTLVGTYPSVLDPSVPLNLYDTTILADGYNSRLVPAGDACDKTGDGVLQRSIFVETY